MKKILFIAFLSICSLVAYSQKEAVDPKAKAILDKATAALDNKKGMVASFSITVENARDSKKDSYAGSVSLKGEKFKLSLLDVDTYFDGRTQSVFMKKEKEVTISAPDKEDLKEINPLLLIKSYKTNYKMKYVGVENIGNKQFEKIELYPNDLKNGYSIITLSIGKESMMLKSICLKGKNGVTTSFVVDKIENKDLSDTLFVYNTANYPGVEVIDLR